MENAPLLADQRHAVKEDIPDRPRACQGSPQGGQRSDDEQVPNCYIGQEPVISAMNYQHIVTLEPGKRGGHPCVRGLLIAVADVLGWLAAGMSHQQILSDYPELTEEDIRACLAYAADRERRIVTAK